MNNIKLKPNSTNNYKELETITEQLFKHNGIENPHKYLDLVYSSKAEHKEQLLNINKAVHLLDKHLDNYNKIHILVDCDTDGYTSGAIMYMYLLDKMKEKGIDVNTHLSYSLHQGKEHGLSSDIDIPSDIKLLIIPDASSNDYEQHEVLFKKGIDILVLDHHEAPKISEYATVVNNQLCDYPNKQLCGAGIVYKFIQALDDFYWDNTAYKYIDLVALALISDSMNQKETETRYYINKGLENINNKLFDALINKQSFSTKGITNPTTIAFYITPLINAMIRIGSQEEKDMMFRAFCELDETFPYQKRGSNEVVDEDIYTRVARLCSNIKAKQSKEVEKNLIKLISLGELQQDNKVIFIEHELDDNGLTGLLAIKLSTHFNRPVLLYKKNLQTSKYTGSGRSLNNITTESFKQFLIDSKIVKAEGHPMAFGIVDINIKKLNELQEYCNTKLDFDNSIIVDFIVPFEELTPQFIITCSQFQDFVGKGIDDCQIAVTNIPLNEISLEVIGTKEDTLKIDCEYFNMIKFKTLSDTINKIQNSDYFNITGKCTINSFNGNISPQIIIDEIIF